jgi:hypothetical protein
MSNKEQSSVEWLFEQIARRQGSILQTIPFYDDNQDLLQQAKAMHKEETCQFVSDYLDDAADYGMTAEEYYDQIYGGNNG